MSTKLRIVAIAALVWVAFNGLPHVPLVHDPPLIDAPGLNVLIVRERDDDRDLPAAQVSVFTSQILRDFVNQNGGEMRVWDDDVDASHADAKWQKALGLKRDRLPWMYSSGPGGNYSGDVPKSVDETMAAIGKCK